MFEAAAANGTPVRGYLSCVLGCPYEGAIAPAAVAASDMGVADLTSSVEQLERSIAATADMDAEAPVGPRGVLAGINRKVKWQIRGASWLLC